MYTSKDDDNVRTTFPARSLRALHPSLPPQQQLRVVLALQVFVDEVSQELFEDVGGILQLALQHRHDQRGHITAVPHGEAALRLQRADEGQQENLVVDQLGKELQALLHPFLSVARHLHRKKGKFFHFPHSPTLRCPVVMLLYVVPEW